MNEDIEKYSSASEVFHKELENYKKGNPSEIIQELVNKHMEILRMRRLAIADIESDERQITSLKLSLESTKKELIEVKQELQILRGRADTMQRQLNARKNG